MRILAALLLLAGPLPAGAAQVALSASTPTATIGEHVELRVVVRAGPEVSGIRVEVPPGSYDIVRRRSLPPRRTAGGSTHEEIITIAFFEVGDFVVGPLAVELLPRGAEPAGAASGEVAIRVRSLLGENDRDIQPIKEPFALSGDPRHLLPYAGGLLLLLLLALAALLLWRARRRRRRPAAEPPPPAEMELEAALRELRRLGLPQAGEFRRFFISLSATLKRFIERAYGFNAEECTTAETVALLQRGEDDREIVASLSGTLALSDLVKFAKQVPGAEAVEAIWPRLDGIVAAHRQRRLRAEEDSRVQAGR